MQSAVLRECIVNLARVKEAVAQSVGGTLDAAGLDSWQDLMRGIKAGLLMLGKSRAVELIEGITTQLKRVMQPGGTCCRRASSTAWRMPSSASSTTWRRCRPGARDPWYMLDNAQACLQALEQQPSPSVPTVPPLEPGAYAQTVQIASVHAAARRSRTRPAWMRRPRRSPVLGGQGAARSPSTPIRSC